MSLSYISCSQLGVVAGNHSPHNFLKTLQQGSQYLHGLDLREVPRRNLVFSLQLNIDFWKPVDKFSLLIFFSKHIGHFLLQVADDVGMYLRGICQVSTHHTTREKR